MDKSKKNGIMLPSVLIGIFAGLVIKLFIFDVLHISGTSMEPTLHDSTAVLVNRLAYGIVKPGSQDFFVQWSQPELNDIVIFLHDNKIVVKRCAGVSGDQLEFSQNSEYIVKINQQEISLTPVQFHLMKNFDSIPEGYIFALGDNQKDSIDSRDYGFVSVKNVMGKIVGK